MKAAADRRKESGFTLIELIVVVTIIGILASIAVVNVINAGRRAREAALRHDLSAMRKAIDDYYADKQKYPPGLQDLVEAKYLRAIPKNPISGKAEDWDPVMQDPTAEDPGSDPNPAADSTPGMVDVKSPPIPPNEFLDDHTPYDQF
jgi:general secretion pathway protein G